jgi:hypothetical protein
VTNVEGFMPMVGVDCQVASIGVSSDSTSVVDAGDAIELFENAKKWKFPPHPPQFCVGSPEQSEKHLAPLSGVAPSRSSSAVMRAVPQKHLDFA